MHAVYLQLIPPMPAHIQEYLVVLVYERKFIQAERRRVFMSDYRWVKQHTCLKPRGQKLGEKNLLGRLGSPAARNTVSCLLSAAHCKQDDSATVTEREMTTTTVGRQEPALCKRAFWFCERPLAGTTTARRSQYNTSVAAAWEEGRAPNLYSTHAHPTTASRGFRHIVQLQ
ncbi:hypothetical protein BaRGS_00007187 [Batillaria attramentaria]|uniref:Uncharacterized protein n=1 Tax=Batillaria attramentaria TaxID=370345 RepID=A0ABD0LRH6_9CAEN